MGGSRTAFRATNEPTPQSPLLYRAQNVPQRRHRAANDATLLSDVEQGLTGETCEEANFLVGQSMYSARLESSGLTLAALSWHPLKFWKSQQIQVAFGSILSVELMEKLPLRLRCRQWLKRKKGGIALTVHAMKRSCRNLNEWRHLKIVLFSEDPSVGRGWAAEVNRLVREVSSNRPSRLLVVLNPHSGSGRAQKIWCKYAQPLLHLAGIETVAVDTRYAGHGQQMIEDLTPEELESYDGVIAVGGDGMFQEVMHGLLSVRSKGGPAGAWAENLRVSQIPAGSTDAVAWTLHGTHCPVTAALHVALGEFGNLDVMRVDSGDGKSQYSVCYAAYGYMGDLMRRSERIRWIGPFRYVLSGIAAFLLARSYAAQIFYIPAHTPSLPGAGDVECLAGCNRCASGVILANEHEEFSVHSSHAFKGEPSKLIEGTYRSVMVVVTACRSDMSPAGLSPHSHLCDGRIQIILVRQCSQFDYLRFLISIPKTGVIRGQFDFVEIIDATAARIVPQGKQSSWNVDGELLKNNFVETRIHRGLMRTFSAGPSK